jgi:multidrug efflux pump subunit AcrA (membrane-fusion protein)
MKDWQLTKVWMLWGVGLLLAGCSSGGATAPTSTPEISETTAPGVVIAEGRVEPIRFAEIALNASGLVGEVLQKEGDRVTAGQLIASLENGEAKTLESAQADALQKVTKAYELVRDSQYELDIFEVPPEFSGLTPTQAVETTLEKLNVARTDFEPYKYVEVKQLELTPAEKDEPVLRSTPKRLKKALDDAWTKYRKAIQWLDRESALQDAKAQLAQSQQDYDSLHDASFGEKSAGLRAALANAEVRAPFGGIITNLDLKVGEFAASGAPVVTIADLSSWIVKTTDLTEIDVVNLKEGRPVTVTLDALPNVTLKGYILSISQNYTLKQGDIVYEVTVLLADKHPSMRWGMTAQVSFAR